VFFLFAFRQPFKTAPTQHGGTRAARQRVLVQAYRLAKTNEWHLRGNRALRVSFSDREKTHTHALRVVVVVLFSRYVKQCHNVIRNTTTGTAPVLVKNEEELHKPEVVRAG
jgi:hypothetical protein